MQRVRSGSHRDQRRRLSDTDPAFASHPNIRDSRTYESDPKAAPNVAKASPIATSVADFVGLSKTRGAELISVSENPSLKYPISDCFAALRAAGQRAPAAHLHRVEVFRAAWRRSSGGGHRRVGGLDGPDGSAAQKPAPDGLRRRLTLWIGLQCTAHSGQPRQQLWQRSWLRIQCSFAWYWPYQH